MTQNRTFLAGANIRKRLLLALSAWVFEFHLKVERSLSCSLAGMEFPRPLYIDAAVYACEPLLPLTVRLASFFPSRRSKFASSPLCPVGGGQQRIRACHLHLTYLQPARLSLPLS